MKKTVFMLAVAFAMAASPAFAQSSGAPAQRANIRGTIIDLQGSVLTVGTVNGPVKVNLLPTGAVRTVARRDFSDIKSGSFVQIASVPLNDGSLKAVEVTIAGAARPPEGHTNYDLFPKSQMTNATVSAINTVQVQGADNRVLTVTYKDGTKRIIIPESAPIVTVVPGTRADLVPGGKVVLINTTVNADGSFTAGNVTVSKNGIDPPN
jgi:hypothetical protein